MSLGGTAKNLHRLHTTPLGEMRIRRNLSLGEGEDAVEYCKGVISSPGSVTVRRGKNFYISAQGVTVTVNAGSYTIITAHRVH